MSTNTLRAALVFAFAGLAACGPETSSPATPRPASSRLNVPNLVPAKAIYASKFSTCALTESGSLQCWNSSRQPRVVDLHSPVTAAAMGPENTCAATEAGEVWCWKENNAAPLPVSGLPARTVSLAVSAAQSCALLEDGSVFCWGAMGSAAVEVMGPGSGALAISTETDGVRATACALLASGSVRCWGDNTDGRLGTGQPESVVTVPADVLGLPRAVTLAMHGSKRCVLDETGSVWGWGGWNEAAGPIQLAAPRAGRLAMEMGPEHACMVNSDGTAECFGVNRSGQLGTWDQSAPSPTTVVPVKGLSVSALALGETHTCALTRTGSIQCFGAGGGALGPTPRMIELHER